MMIMNNNNKQEEEFLDLLRFKEENAKKPDLLLYHRTKKSVALYRIIFLILGLLFLGFSAIIWVKSALWITSTIKPFIAFFTVLMSVTSFTIAFMLNYENEAVRALYHHTVKHLNQIYKIRQTKTLKDSDLPVNEIIRKKIALRAHYKQTKEKLKKLELESFELMTRISHDSELTIREKEKLYNQTLMELKNNYAPVVQKYIDRPIPKLPEEKK